MKTYLIIGLTVFLLVVPTIGSAEVPHGVGGFVLDHNIKEYEDRVIMETALPIRHMENIEEVEIKFTDGFKSGLIAYANCTRPGHIVRIKLKYADSSKDFFKQLLKRYKKKFGEPDEYRGDPFHIAIAWKWSFVDSKNNRISLTLQHNARSAEGKMGNAVKLTLTNLMEDDRLCFKKKSDARERLRQRKWETVDPGITGWDLFVPQ
jgi:hypothetical protein